MTRRQHWIAVAICLVMLLCVFASSALIVHEAVFHHHCAGENCPICQFIAQVEQVRRAFGVALLALLMVWVALFAHREWHCSAGTRVPAFCTLVGRKIRLND